MIRARKITIYTLVANQMIKGRGPVKNQVFKTTELDAKGNGVTIKVKVSMKTGNTGIMITPGEIKQRVKTRAAGNRINACKNEATHWNKGNAGKE